MKKLFFVIIFWVIKSTIGQAQVPSPTLSVDQFLEIVRLYHPVIKLNRININKTEADILIAKGAFNPVLSTNFANKTIDNTTYYNYQNPNISIPTWFGAEVSGGIENLSGNRFDPSETVGQTSYLGVSVPLLKNLVFDKRRAYLQLSKRYLEMAEIEQTGAINNILMDAVTQYWQWVNAFHVYETVLKTEQNSFNRFEYVKKTFLNGERPAIDTIEAKSQYLNFVFQKNDSYLNLLNETLELNTFLWKENNIPYELPKSVVPEKIVETNEYLLKFNTNLEDLIAKAQTWHPELKMYEKKFEMLEIDKKLKFQELLPKLDFKYNHLAKGYNVLYSKGLLFQNNYQYGIKFEMPLLLSQGRGEYKKAKLKIEENNISQAQKRLSIDFKVKKYYNEFINLRSQVSVQKDILISFQKLLTAEETLFKNGESSLFLINSRENKVLETQRKLIELNAKFLKSLYAMQWSVGGLN